MPVIPEIAHYMDDFWKKFNSLFHTWRHDFNMLMLRCVQDFENVLKQKAHSFNQKTMIMISYDWRPFDVPLKRRQTNDFLIIWLCPFDLINDLEFLEFFFENWMLDLKDIIVLNLRSCCLQNIYFAFQIKCFIVVSNHLKVIYSKF